MVAKLVEREDGRESDQTTSRCAADMRAGFDLACIVGDELINPRRWPT
jgi:hypothetical protein